MASGVPTVPDSPKPNTLALASGVPTVPDSPKP
jgi:hypothetical protein